MKPFLNEEVERIITSYPPVIQHQVLEIRQLIIETHEELFPEEELVENLKWNQPTYTSKSGTPIRIAQFDEDRTALLFHCQTTLIEQFREMFSDTLVFSKNRAIVLNAEEELPVTELKMCIQLALNYHQKN